MQNRLVIIYKFCGRTGLYALVQLRAYKPFIRSFQSNDRRCLQFPIINHDIVFSKPLNTKCQENDIKTQQKQRKSRLSKKLILVLTACKNQLSACRLFLWQSTQSRCSWSKQRKCSCVRLFEQLNFTTREFVTFVFLLWWDSVSNFITTG